MRQLIIFFAIVCLAALSPLASSASESKISSIPQNCASIKISLQNLQKIDSRTRVYLGTEYENILNNFMTPLNLRLIKNHQDASSLTSIQASFSSEKEFLSRSFVDYSKSLDELIAHDCTSDPSGFYSLLERTREKRAAVRSSFLRLNDEIERHRAAVSNLKKDSP